MGSTRTSRDRLILSGNDGDDANPKQERDVANAIRRSLGGPLMISGKGAQPRYTVVIQWSDEDQCYVVSLPEWGPYAKTHGDTYEEAARNAQEVLELLMEDENGRPVDLPAPKLFHYPGAGVVDLPADTVGARRQEAGPTRTRQTA